MTDDDEAMVYEAAAILPSTDTVRVRLHTGPVTPPDDTITHLIFDFDPTTDEDDDPYDLDMTDATTTGIGDPLADVLRSIDEVLDEQ